MTRGRAGSGAGRRATNERRHVAESPTASTGLVALLGNPVGHSVSPAIHNAAFRAQRLDLVYLACCVKAEHMAEAMAGLHALGALGANVTIPHKTVALAHAASASATAQTLGAANTLVRTASGWHADNTDVEGFLAPLGPHAAHIKGERIVVLGAGGAARAVVYACLRDLAPAQLDVIARRPEQAEALLNDLAPLTRQTETRALPEADASVSQAALVINATPLGMGDGRSSWPLGDFHVGQIVYDLVYRPTETPLLRAASARGAVPIGGLPMLLGQAAESYRLWTGREMPLDVARSAAYTALGLT